MLLLTWGVSVLASIPSALPGSRGECPSEELLEELAISIEYRRRILDVTLPQLLYNIDIDILVN